MSATVLATAPAGGSQVNQDATTASMSGDTITLAVDDAAELEDVTLDSGTKKYVAVDFDFNVDDVTDVSINGTAIPSGTSDPGHAIIWVDLDEAETTMELTAEGKNDKTITIVVE